MPERFRKYKRYLNPDDRVSVCFTTERGRVIKFAIQYDALINGRWHSIIRFDNAHGGPHRHIFYPSGIAKRLMMAETDSNRALTAAEMIVKRKFKEFRSRYIMLMKKGD